MKKVLIAAGGTGGHTFPAASLGEELEEKGIQVLYLGKNLPKPFREIASGLISPRRPLQSIRGAIQIFRGILQSIRLIRKSKPDLMIGFGSVYTLPILIAAKIMRVPFILHEQNCIPGRVNRLMSGSAKCTAITFPESSQYFAGNTEQVAMPLRKGYRCGSVSPCEARRYFGLDPKRFTLLVFGGSQGATAINDLVLSAAEFPAIKGIQILHFVGRNDSAVRILNCYRQQGITACVKEFEDRMDFAWQASDLIVSRAGAGSISEQIAFEVPGILIPYPYATDNHQEKNADFMQYTVKGGVKFLQSELNSEALAEQLAKMMRPGALETMQNAIQDYKRQNPQNQMAELVCKNL